MKVCKVCQQSDMLCSACSKNVQEGKIKQIDVELCKALNAINKEKNYDLDFLETVDDNGKLYVIVESGLAGKFIGPGGRTIRKISETIGKQIKLLEKTTGNDKTVIEKLIGTPIIGVNKVYFGAESYKVRVSRKYIKNVQPLTSVVEKILDKKVNFVFE